MIQHSQCSQITEQMALQVSSLLLLTFHLTTNNEFCQGYCIQINEQWFFYLFTKLLFQIYVRPLITLHLFHHNKTVKSLNILCVQKIFKMYSLIKSHLVIELSFFPSKFFFSILKGLVHPKMKILSLLFTFSMHAPSTKHKQHWFRWLRSGELFKMVEDGNSGRKIVE